MNTLYFKVADACFCVNASDLERVKSLIPSFAPFHIPANGELQITTLDLVENQLGENPEGSDLGTFDCANGTYHIYLLDEGYKFVIYGMDGRLGGVLRSNSQFTHSELSLYGSMTNQSFALNNALMTSFTFAAAHHNILMMHASVIAHQGKGYLFLGQSGTGKSTHSQLWLRNIEDTELLNDDNPAIRIMKDGEVRVYGTPWSGKTPCYKNKYCPVQAFVRLEQYPENIIKQEPGLRAFSSLLSSSSTMIWDEALYNLITLIVEQVTDNTSVYHLKCLPNREAALLCHQTVTQPQ